MKKSKKQKLKYECVGLAIKICLKLHPKCEFCGQLAETGHHPIRQSRSNALRCNQKNIVAVCGKCHAKIHIGNFEGIMMLQLEKARGKEWRDYLIKHEHDQIKDDMFYWQKKKIILESELNNLINLKNRLDFSNPKTKELFKKLLA